MPEASGCSRRVPSGAVAVFSGGGTGGHLYPALALADALGALRPDVRPFFVGAERGLEALILPERGMEHILLPIRGFHRGALWPNLGVLGDLFRSLVATARTFFHLRPQVVVVTGGYAGGPAGLMAGIMGIPLALQEQNSFPGITTRVLSRWSEQIHLAFPEAREHLPRRAARRARVSGNPIRRPKLEGADAARSHFGLSPSARVLLVVGGSQGSSALNGAVLEMVEGMERGRLDEVEDLELLWATGPHHFTHTRSALESLGNPSWVRIVDYIRDMPRALEAASLAVSRAGAMATSEFLAWGVPAVLVPLPTAAADHQTRNAESLAAAGTALHVPESGLTGTSLWQEVTALLRAPEKLEAMRRAALQRGRPKAAEEIALALSNLLPRAVRGRA